MTSEVSSSFWLISNLNTQKSKHFLNFIFLWSVVYEISTFVCPSNSGFGTLTEITQVKPSLTCSPLKVMSFSWKWSYHGKNNDKEVVENIVDCHSAHGTLMTLDFFAKLLSDLVNEALTPSMWVPPSTVLILFAYPNNVSEYASEHLYNKGQMYQSPFIYQNECRLYSILTATVVYMWYRFMGIL